LEWTEVEILTTSSGIDMICSMLTDIGINGFTIQDAEDFNTFLNEKSPKWDYIDETLMALTTCETKITVYLPRNSQGVDMMRSIRSLLNNIRISDTLNIYGKLEMNISTVNESEWADNWKKYFKPLKIGDKLLIKPSWEKCSDTEGRTVLEIDPASSFGTGQHHTTRLCLELLESTVNKGDTILDIGCGSGILSIGGVLLGAEKAVAVDIEKNATVIAKTNAQRNNISDEKYEVHYGNILSDKTLLNSISNQYDIIVANIVADVLIAMSQIFGKLLKKDGALIVSGIIEERMNEVADVIKDCGFVVSSVNVQDGWAAIKFSKE